MYYQKKYSKNGLDYVQIYNQDQKTELKLCLDQGGRIDLFKVEDIEIIKCKSSQSYKSDFNSAILFPFVNRLRDGKYNFNGIGFELPCNEPSNNNALHGLVCDKTFKVMSSKTSKNNAAVELLYTNKGDIKGFPFPFDLKLNYELSKAEVSLQVEVINNGKTPFPFALGWHPYFLSSNLEKSAIDFRGNLKFTFDNQQIINDKKPFELTSPMVLKDVNLDDCFRINPGDIRFSTPRYIAKINSTSQTNYLQLYIPPDRESIAIEPMTSVCDSFNNSIDVSILNPNSNYQLEWKTKVQII